MNNFFQILFSVTLVAAQVSSQYDDGYSPLLTAIRLNMEKGAPIDWRDAPELQNLNDEEQQVLEELMPHWEEGWENYLNIEDPCDVGSKENITYLLWTRENPEVEEIWSYKLSENDIESGYFKASRQTFVLYHGYTSHGKTEWILDSRDELLKKMDCNVISVDYSLLVPGPCYVRSVINVAVTGRHTGLQLSWMHRNLGLDYKKVHLIGHSLGGQCAGRTGHFLDGNATVARVTGLDPAGPLYYNGDDDQTISETSADFVDIIHTNGGFLLSMGVNGGCLGLYRKVGHVDFYPNGGVHQLGCPEESNSTSTDEDLIDMWQGCSHHRSVLFWVESINAQEPEDKTFWSYTCSSYDDYTKGYCHDCGLGCQQMGYPAKRFPEGHFYLSTAKDAPYALGGASILSISSTKLVAALLFLAVLGKRCSF